MAQILCRPLSRIKKSIMKKITYLSLAVVFFLLTYRNSVATVQEGVRTTNEGYQFTILIHKGWNLVPLHNVGTFDLLPLHDLNDVIKSMFVYLPMNNKYVEFYGGFNDTTLVEFQNNQKYLHLGAVWIYANGDTDITYSTKSNALDVLPGTLYKGWNLMTVPPQFFDKSYGWGSCDVEKIFSWDEIYQKWSAWPMDLDPKLDKFLEEASEGDFIGYGVAVKVRDNCSISKTGIRSGVVTPPNIPK